MRIIFVLKFIVIAFLMGCSGSPKSAFILNQDVFEAFKGKEMLKKKLSQVTTQHAQQLDSLDRIMKEGNNAYAIQAYEEMQYQFQLQEQELTTKYTADIWIKINEYISDYGKEKGYDYIFGASGNGNLMYARDTHNITKEVTEYVNQRYANE